MKSGAKDAAVQTLHEFAGVLANAKRLDCVRFTAAFVHRQTSLSFSS